MSVGGPIRLKSARSRGASGRFAVEFAPIAIAVLLSSIKLAEAQWGSEPPPIDPFAQAAPAPAFPNNAAANVRMAATPGPYGYGPAEPMPPPAAMNPAGPQYGPASMNSAGPQYGPANVYLPGPQYGPPVAYPPPAITEAPQFQDGVQYPRPIPAPARDGTPAGNIPPEDQSMIPAGTNSAYHLLDHLEGNVVARGYYANDQRIEWSGMEATFGGEAVLTPRLRQRCGDFEFLLDSELNINQPFDQDQLLND